MADNDTEPITKEARAAVEQLLGPITIQEALSRVMEDVQSVSKDSRNTQQNFNFRGIDAVMNAVGPALRKHGVVVVPIGAEATTESYTTRNGALMKNVMLHVRFRFHGPDGSTIEAAAMGEAADAGDKATPKAHSVAFRTLLLQALCIPTDEPDPDSSTHERAALERPQGDAQDAPGGASEPQRPTAQPELPDVPLEAAQNTAVHFGKNEGVTLGSMSDQQVDWYAKSWEPSYGDARDAVLRAAARKIVEQREIPF